MLLTEVVDPGWITEDQFSLRLAKWRHVDLLYSFKSQKCALSGFGRDLLSFRLCRARCLILVRI